MRWHTGIQHETKTPPKVSLAPKPAKDVPPEVKIDVRGGGIYLSVAEAKQLADDLLAVVNGVPS